MSQPAAEHHFNLAKPQGDFTSPNELHGQLSRSLIGHFAAQHAEYRRTVILGDTAQVARIGNSYDSIANRFFRARGDHLFHNRRTRRNEEELLATSNSILNLTLEGAGRITLSAVLFRPDTIDPAQQNMSGTYPFDLPTGVTPEPHDTVIKWYRQWASEDESRRGINYGNEPLDELPELTLLGEALSAAD